MICFRLSLVAILAAVTLGLLLTLCLTCEQSYAQDSLARYTRQAGDDNDDNADDNSDDLDDPDDQQAVVRKSSPKPRGGSSTTPRTRGRSSTTPRTQRRQSTTPRRRPGQRSTTTKRSRTRPPRTSAKPTQPADKDGPPPRAICVYRNRKLQTINKLPYDLSFDPFCHVGECHAKSKTKCPGDPYALPNPIIYQTSRPVRRLEPWELPDDYPKDRPTPKGMPKPPNWWKNRTTRRPGIKGRDQMSDADDSGDEEQDDEHQDD